MLANAAQTPGEFLELRSFADGRRAGAISEHIPTRATDGDIDAALNWARQQFEQGRSIFAGYNARQGKGMKKADVRRVVACYTDLDLETNGISRETAMKRAVDAPVKPNLVVDSGRGLHLIWFFSPTDDKAKWTAVQTRVTGFFALVGADNAIRTDEARVMRLAGFPNRKEGIARPTSIVRYVQPEARTLEDLVRAFGVGDERTEKTEGLKAFDTGKEPLAEVIGEGGRNDRLYREACALRARGWSVPEIEAALFSINEIRCQPPLDGAEVRAIAESASRYEAGDALTRGVEGALPEGSLFKSWGEMSLTAYEPPEYVVYGLTRGDVGMLQAPSNQGKSSLLRGLSISLACGTEFLTLADAGEPRRVMLLDYETAYGRFHEDLGRMTARLDSPQQSLVKENLFSYVAKSRGVPHLNLSDAAHYNRLLGEVKAFQPDLIIIDTVTAGMAIVAENDNGEVTNRVMKPLINLASESNAALVFSHHVGKAGSEEGAASNRIYRARGASAFEGMSAAVVELDVSRKNQAGERALVLSYRKVKDEPKPDLVLKLDQMSRWFEVAEGETTFESSDDQYRQMLGVITAPMRKGEIDAATPLLADTTRKRYLDRAVREGKLVKPQRGVYHPAA
jgi:hypothetical protein